MTDYKISVGPSMVFVPFGFRGFRGGKSYPEILEAIVRQGHIPPGVKVLAADHPRLLVEIPTTETRTDMFPMVRWVEPDGATDTTREALDRYERDLPMTATQVAQVLQISERTVRRKIPTAAHRRPGGAGLYSRQQVEAAWQDKERARNGGTGTRRRTVKASRSSIAGKGAGNSKRLSLVTGESGRPSVDAVEKRLLGKLPPD